VWAERIVVKIFNLFHIRIVWVHPVVYCRDPMYQYNDDDPDKGRNIVAESLYIYIYKFILGKELF
jgi:hypothetical protein